MQLPVLVGRTNKICVSASGEGFNSCSASSSSSTCNASRHCILIRPQLIENDNKLSYCRERAQTVLTEKPPNVNNVPCHNSLLTLSSCTAIPVSDKCQTVCTSFTCVDFTVIKQLWIVNIYLTYILWTFISHVSRKTRPLRYFTATSP